MSQVDAEVKELLAQHEYLQLVETGAGDQKRVRIRCDLTQHEMLPRRDAIETHLKGKKFLKAKEWYCYDYSKYEPYIVQHRRKPKSLFCNVTNTILNRIPAEVENHVNGKKFQRLKAHVSFTKRGGDDEDDGTFDANAFEFENQQLIYSDLEDEEEGKPQPKKAKKKRGDDSDDDDDDDEDDEELEDDEEQDDSEVDDDMAEFYPQSDDGENEEDEHIREAVKRLTVKKRKASADGSHDESMPEESESSPAPKSKKLKATGETKPKAVKPNKAKKGGK